MRNFKYPFSLVLFFLRLLYVLLYNICRDINNDKLLYLMKKKYIYLQLHSPDLHQTYLSPHLPPPPTPIPSTTSRRIPGCTNPGPSCISWRFVIRTRSSVYVISQPLFLQSFCRCCFFPKHNSRNWLTFDPLKTARPNFKDPFIQKPYIVLRATSLKKKNIGDGPMFVGTLDPVQLSIKTRSEC